MFRRAVFLIAMIPMAEVTGAASKLDEIPAYSLGIDALSGQLWDVAAARFQDALGEKDLEAPQKQDLLLRLAEAQIRGGKSEAAIKTLSDPTLAENPAVPFWTGQALAATGRFSEAIESLKSGATDAKSPHRREALLTQAELERAIGDTEGALATVDVLLKSDSRSIPARLLKASLLLDQGLADEALKMIPADSNLDDKTAAEAKFLRAQSLLATKKYEDALAIFNALIESPKGQTLDRYHAAILSRARTRLDLGATAVAADGLLAFIQQNPKSPRLDEAFDLLMECVPEQPTPNDAILTRIREWIPKVRLTSPAIPSSSERAAASWPFVEPDRNPLAPEAMFHLALGLRRENSIDSRAAARRMLNRLRLEYPKHPLIPRVMLEAGRWDLEDGRREQAASHFAALINLPNVPPELRAQGLTLEGTARFKEKNFEGAAELFTQAASLLENEQRNTARLNAATSLLSSGSLAAFEELSSEVENSDLQDQLDLERALFLASKRDPAALPALRAFVEQHPEHPRLPETRLNAALAALDAIPPDVEFAQQQLDAISKKTRLTLPPDQLALAEIHLHNQLGEWAEAAERAKTYLKEHKASPMRHSIQFEQGKALFQNKDYNAARLVLEKLALEAPDSPQAAAALLLSARAAAEGATPQSQTESINLFNKLIESNSPFADVARLEKADMLIHRLSRLEDAIQTLDPWFKKMKKDDPLLLSVGLLLGEALFASAENNTEVLVQALAVYDRLLEELPKDSPSRSSILYRKGMTLERFEIREDEALDCYVGVVQVAGDSSRTDWKSVELCGFSALRILEKREQWAAAKKFAERIADLKGPRSQEAADRAKDIGLEHMIWDDQINSDQENPAVEKQEN
ncbi:tetratricopeptide repeat protein [Haloferula chungangensis]|uniref:Tetratricopeptide repeat protein n=1 Tax=Haloferula chungangensis TaxID=1048331 RepID=A0ABW2LBM4_9BACT